MVVGNDAGDSSSFAHLFQSGCYDGTLRLDGDRSVGFLNVEDRAHRQLLLEGAVMSESGGLEPIVGVRHDLRFDDGLDLTGGAVEVLTRGGAAYPIDLDASGRGGYLPGGWRCCPGPVRRGRASWSSRTPAARRTATGRDRTSRRYRR